MGTYYRAKLIAALGLGTVKGRVLDIGGFDGFFVSTVDADERISVDIDSQPRFAGVRYCRADGLALPFADDSFDTIYALDVLEHVDDEARFATELMRVLRRGGRLILSTPQDDIQVFPKPVTPWVNKRWQHYRVPGYSSEAVRALFDQLHACDCQVRKLSSWWFLNFYFPLSAVWRVAPKAGAWVLGTIATLDAKRTGPRGYLLAEIQK